MEQSIPERFGKIVGRYPERLAVKDKDRSLTYDELNKATNRIARAILEKRGPGSEPIALLFDHGIDAIAGMLGVLKAGKFYVALDPAFPLERLEYILKDSQTKMLVTNNRNANLSNQLTAERVQRLGTDELDASYPDGNLDPLSNSADALVRICYTSGSTGDPKGVVLNHRQGLQFSVQGAARRNISEWDRFSLVHSVSFGSSSTEIFQSLLNGAALCLYDLKANSFESFAKFLEQENITVCHLSPATFRLLVGSVSALCHLTELRLLYLSGAPIMRADYELYRQKLPRVTLLEVSMGSTEVGLICTTILDHEFNFPNEGTPIGYAPQGKTILILDDARRELAPGEVGEIAVKSKNLDTGYWGRDELTNERYLTDPNGGAERIYLTGDLGRMLPDGFVIHLGRKDLMVKIRGYRVELAEIEKVLLAHPLVKDAGVAAWDYGAGEKYLVGYVVPCQESALNVSDLNEFLRNKLPDYMIPSAFMFLDSLPLTNGKLDRRGLPEPDHSRPQLSTSYAPPQDEIENKLIRVWEDVLKVTPIGIDDNFFDLGGHSLLAAQLFTRLDDEFHRLLPLSMLLSAPTGRLLAQHYRNIAEPDTIRALVPLRVYGNLPPVFAIPGVYGNVVGLADLCREMGPDQPFYGLQSIGLDGKEEPFDSMEDMARRYVEEIFRVQPSGPIAIVGACFGAGVAWEMTYQILEAGSEIAFLGLLDPIGLTIDRSSEPETRSHSVPERTPALKVFVVDRLRLYWQEMRRLETRHRMTFLSDKFHSLARNVVDRKAMRSVRREIHQLQVFEASRRAGKRYRPKRLNRRLGALEIFTSQHPRHVRIEIYPWDTVWNGAVVFHRMPGADSGEMLSGDNARVLGTTLNERLCAARAFYDGKTLA